MTTLTALTEEQKRRVESEKANTEKRLQKELSISEDLQYKDVIDRLQNHISHLNNIIENGWNKPVFN